MTTDTLDFALGLLTLSPHPAVPAPIHGLPAEILSQIMLVVVKDPLNNFWDGGQPSRDVDRRAINLAHVCSQWRLTALSTPMLWQNISVTQTTSLYYSSGVYQASPEYYRFLLQNSAQLPLDIAIEILPVGAPPSAMLREVLESATRWQRVQLHLSPSKNSLHLPLNFTNPLISLRELSVTGHWQLPFSWSFAAPLLRSISMENHLVFGLPWHQLTTVRVSHFCSAQIHEIVSKCPALEALAIRLLINDVDLPVVTAGLTTLHLTSSLYRQVEPFLRGFILPALSTLHIGQESWLNGIPPLVTRSSCNLQSICFKLESLSPPVADFVDCLGAITGLKHLRFEGLIRSNQFVPFLRHLILVFAGRREGILPNLSTLKISGLRSRRVSRTLVQVIRSRWPTPFHPEAVPLLTAIYCDKIGHSRTPADLQLLRDEGFDLRLTEPEG